MQLLRANPGRLIVLAAGSVSVALAASALLVASTSSLAVVQQQLDAGWRGPYDLLVRPADTALGVGGRVPANYLGVPGTGISRDEWNAVQGIPGVAVAAPVASLGWLTDGGPPVSVELQGLAAETVYMVDVEASVGGERVVSHAGAFARPAEPGPWTLTVGLGSTADFGDGTVHLDLAQLPSVWGLVVGIDPVAEDQLIGLEHFVAGRALTRGVSRVFDQQLQREAIGVPVTTAAHSEVPGTLQISVVRVDGVAPQQVLAALDTVPPPTDNEGIAQYESEVTRRLHEIAAGAPVVPIIADAAPLGELLTPLREPRVALTVNGELTADASSYGSAWGIERSVVLVPEPTSYAVLSNSRLRLDEIGTWEVLVLPRLKDLAQADYTLGQANLANGRDEPMYRPLAVATPPPFVLQPLGTVDIAAIADEYERATSYAPLGIYGEAPRRLVETPAGQLVDERLPASLNPGGINPLPPFGLTNLEAVEALRGERFIDAIRVRVAGIDHYTPAAVAKVEDVAAAIIERTGLRVDVVAGAAASDVEVEVPGVGVITERWTTLGEAPRIESGATGLSAALLLGAVAVALAYLLTFGLVLVEDQAPERATLRLIGWRRRTVLQLLVGQAVVIGLGSAILAILLLALTGMIGGFSVVPTQYLVLVVTVLAAHLIAVAAIGAVADGGSFAASLRGRSVTGTGRAAGSIAGLAIAQALESRLRFAGTATALAAAVTLAGVIAIVELAFGGALRATLFGQQIALRAAPYHLLAAGAALFAAGAVVLDSALLTVERRVALIGLLGALGWTGRQVRALILAEALMPVVVAACLAAVLIGGLAIVLGLGPLSPLLAGIAVVLALAVGWLAVRPPLAVASSVAPAISLRAEGASLAVSGLAVRQAVFTVGLLSLAILAGTVGWSRLAPIGIAASEVMATPAPTTQAEDVRRLANDVSAISANAERTIGSRALADSFDWIRRRLTDLGYEVRDVRYLGRVLDLRDDLGEPIRLESAAWPVSLAHDPAGWNGDDLDSPFTPVTLPADGLPECVPGVVVLRLPDEAAAPLATEFLLACPGTTAVLGIVADDVVWQQVDHAAGLRLPVAEHLVATTAEGRPGSPWLVAGLDSAGPGATGSAAPVAVLLEVAQAAAASGLPLNLAIATSAQGGSASILLREIEQAPGPTVILGPMGGQVLPVLGTSAVDDLDEGATRAGLLASVEAADNPVGWLERTADLSQRPTSRRLLDALAGSLSMIATTELSTNAYALAIGLDAAYLGEPLHPEGILSIAGTSVDTAEQTDPRQLAAMARGLIAAIGEVAR